jgi:hypothetical protein
MNPPPDNDPQGGPPNKNPRFCRGATPTAEPATVASS